MNPRSWRRQSREDVWVSRMDGPQSSTAWVLGKWSMEASLCGAEVRSCKEQTVIARFMSKIHPDFGDPQINGVSVIQN